jgi:hypothetical protein
METLAPDLILISVARRHLRKLGPLTWRSFRPFEQSTPQQEMRIATFGHSQIVWGRASRRPFFYLGANERPLAARSILHQIGLT